MISPNFLLWRFCGNAQFSQRVGRITRNSVEAVFLTVGLKEVPLMQWEKLI